MEQRFHTRDFLKRTGLVWLAIAVVVGAINTIGVMAKRFPDPDDIMRLVQVRDLLAGQGWFDMNQYRVNALDGGVNMHWSRLVDIPLAIVIGALTPVLGTAMAENVALVIVPLMTMGIAMLLAARLVWKMLGDDAIAMTCIVMVLSVPLLFQLAPMRIDHHGWQIVCGLVAVNAIMSSNAMRGGLTAGLAMAVWLSISIEGLPLAAAICALLAWRWWRDSDQRGWLAWTMAGLASGSLLAFLGTKGWSDLAVYCDMIAPVHIAMFGWGAATLTALAWFNPRSAEGLLAGFGLAGLGAMAILLSQAPQCAGNSFSQLDPVLVEFWYQRVGEGLPIWRQQPSDILQTAVLPLLGIYASIRLAMRSEGNAQTFWREYSFVLLTAFAIAILVTRAGAMAAALAAVPLGWQLRQWLLHIRTIDSPFKRVGALLAIVLALAPALPLTLLGQSAQASAAPEAKALSASQTKTSACNIAQSAQLMAKLPIGEIYAPLDVSPRLLLETEHSVIATGHHRGERGMVEVIEIALGSVENAQFALEARGTSYVALCPDLNEAQIYAYTKPNGFMAQLIAGNAPEWLEPIAFETESGLKVWRIVAN